MLNYVKMLMEFTEYVQSEMKKRGWSQADLSRQTGMTTGGVSMLLNQTRKPSPETLLTLSKAFQIPPESIFRAAGLLPPEPQLTEGTKMILYLFQQLSDEGKRDLISYARFLLEKNEDA